MTYNTTGDPIPPGAFAHGGNPPMRPDQALQTLSRAGSGPAPQSPVVIARTVIIFGPGGGEFVYDAAGNLRSANVGAVTTDPRHGVTCQQGFSTFNGHGAVINLLSTATGLGAFFQYFDNESNVQGALILAVSSLGGVDPVTGFTYLAGLQGINPVFGNFISTIGSLIALAQVVASITAQATIELLAAPAASSTNPLLQVDAPEQGHSGHVQMAFYGTSPDNTVPGGAAMAEVGTGATIVRATTSVLEIQGTGGAGGQAALTITAGAFRTQAANLGSTPADPAGTVSLTQVMMGLGSAWTITPASSGRVHVIISGLVGTATGVVPLNMSARRSTGAAPVNGAAVVGTVIGASASPTTTQGQAAGVLVPFTINAFMNLAIGTAFWFDLALATTNAADQASFSRLSFTAFEIQ